VKPDGGGAHHGRALVEAPKARSSRRQTLQGEMASPHTLLAWETLDGADVALLQYDGAPPPGSGSREQLAG
jgi:hypothetical protein